MIHGLRNDKAGAVNKFMIAKNRLRKIGYPHPVIGFSYDSNTKGAHLKKYEHRALNAGQIIAKKNGRNLSQFILDFKQNSSKTKIRLIGHSLGSQVIASTIETLSRSKNNKNIIESVHFFGASIPSDLLGNKKFGKFFGMIVNKKIINFFAPTDEVLHYAHKIGEINSPLGLCGFKGKTTTKFSQLKVNPANHRFKSYAETLKSFP